MGIEQEEGPSAGNSQDGIRGAGPVPTLALDAPGTRVLCSLRLQLRPEGAGPSWQRSLTRARLPDSPPPASERLPAQMLGVPSSDGSGGSDHDRPSATRRGLGARL